MSFVAQSAKGRITKKNMSFVAQSGKKEELLIINEFCSSIRRGGSTTLRYGFVAQLNRALHYGCRGFRFES
jgi:hypothetical protein